MSFAYDELGAGWNPGPVIEIWTYALVRSDHDGDHDHIRSDGAYPVSRRHGRASEQNPVYPFLHV